MEIYTGTLKTNTYLLLFLTTHGKSRFRKNFFSLLHRGGAKTNKQTKTRMGIERVFVIYWCYGISYRLPILLSSVQVRREVSYPEGLCVFSRWTYVSVLFGDNTNLEIHKTPIKIVENNGIDQVFRRTISLSFRDSSNWWRTTHRFNIKDYFNVLNIFKHVKY